MAFVPRALLVNNIIDVKKREDAYNIIKAGTFDPSQNVILEEAHEAVEKRTKGAYSADITKYSPNVIELDVKADSKSVLVLSEVYYPEWKAKIDGKESKIFTANGITRAIFVDKGSHKVKFYFDPASFRKGLAVFIVSVICMVIIVTAEVLYYKRKKTNGAVS
jgi:uncharacterized membrane protein YfhO